MEKTAGSQSRLMQMQARFQQKQLQDREQKIASLYEAQQARALERVRMAPCIVEKISPPAIAQAQSPLTRQPGKVRQMFEERRTKGIDKSYPLQPIHNTNRNRAAPSQRNTTTNGYYSKVTMSNASRSLARKTSKQTVNSPIVKKHVNRDKKVNGSGDLNHNDQPDLNSVLKASQTHGKNELKGLNDLDFIDNNYLLEDETFPDALAPAPTPRSPDHHRVRLPDNRAPAQTKTATQPAPKRPPRRSLTVRIASPVKAKNQPIAPPRKPTVAGSAETHNRIETSISNRKSQRAMQAAAPISADAISHLSSNLSSNKTTATCDVCGRQFAPDRIEKHQEICRRTTNKKRKPFDALKHRLAGTEAEALIGKLRAKKKASSTNVKPLNSTWRTKHEEFIATIRAAKEAQAHIASGGKLSDLPPPPPSTNPDYVQCPHCQRRFNEAAAARHIPKCANYQFNKPKQGSR